jgi:hypothetical protein
MVSQASHAFFLQSFIVFRLPVFLVYSAVFLLVILKINKGDALIYKKGTLQPLEMNPIIFAPKLESEKESFKSINPIVETTTSPVESFENKTDVESSHEEFHTTKHLESNSEKVSTTNEQKNPLSMPSKEKKKEAELIFPSLEENVETHSNHVLKPVTKHKSQLSDFTIDQDHAFMQRLMTIELLTHLNIKKPKKADGVIEMRQAKETATTETLKQDNPRISSTAVSSLPFKTRPYFLFFFKNSDTTFLWIVGALFLMLLSILTITLCLPTAIANY